MLFYFIAAFIFHSFTTNEHKYFLCELSVIHLRCVRQSTLCCHLANWNENMTQFCNIKTWTSAEQQSLNNVKLCLPSSSSSNIRTNKHIKIKLKNIYDTSSFWAHLYWLLSILVLFNQRFVLVFAVQPTCPNPSN